MDKIKIAFLGPGWMSSKMARTIMHMPEVEMYAVGSRNHGRASAFAKEFGFKKAYGSYEETVRDSEVDFVYVATPHSRHYEDTMLCLEYGKPALVEKAFTANAAQAKHILEHAAAINILVAEAIWTRYMPLRKTLNELLAGGAIGNPVLLTANLGYPISQTDRIINPALAGGALLDLGVYPINFASMVFGDNPLSVSAEVAMFDTGVDATNNITIKYDEKKVAVLFTTALAHTERAAMIYGDKGRIYVENLTNPRRLRVLDPAGSETACYEAPKQISGYEYQVTSVIKAIRDGCIECPEMPHAEIIRIMEMMDGIRASWGMKFPFEE